MNLVNTNITTDSRKRERLQRNVKSIVTHLILILASAIMLIPFVWMVSTSFKTGFGNISLAGLSLFQ